MLAMGNSKEEKQELFTPFAELCKFADAYDLVIELDKPFVEFPNMVMKVVRKSDGDEVKRIFLDDITTVDDEAAKLLNSLSKKDLNDQI